MRSRTTNKTKGYAKPFFYRVGFLMFLSLLTFNKSAFAQFDGQYSQYMNNLSLINPAYSGEGEMVQVSIFQRTQWMGLKGAPITSMLSVDMPLNFLGTKHGVGIQFLSDIFGVFNNQQANILYSYKKKILSGHLSFGAKLGFVNVICNGDSIKLLDNEYHKMVDPIIPQSKQTGINFDLGLGTQYLSDNWRAGFSLSHLTSPRIRLGDTASIKILPVLDIHAGYDIKPRNPNFKVRLNALLSSDFTFSNLHMSSIFDIKNKFWLGAGWRISLGYGFSDAVSIMLGMNIFEGFRIGYNFDLPTNKLIANTFGSHEVFATYEFSFIRDRSKAVKSIRIL